MMLKKARRCILTICGLIVFVPVICSCGVQAGQVYISETLTCRDISPDGKPVGVTSAFPEDTKRVYFFFDLEGPVSAPLEIRWFFEDTLVFAQEVRAQPGVSRTYMEADETFPPGQHRIKIVMKEVVMAEATFTVAQEQKNY